MRPGRVERETGIVVQDNDVLEEAVRTSTQLGEKLATEFARAGRLESEKLELERVAISRNEQLGQAYESLRHLDEVKFQFLSDLAEQMRTSVSTILETAPTSTGTM